MDTNPHRSCFVYVLRAGDAVKIGVAVNIGARLAALQSGNPMPIEIVGRRKFPNALAAVQAERALHERFSDRRAQGEWFWITSTAAMVALDHFNSAPRPLEGPPRPAVKQEYPAFDFAEQIRLSALAEFYTEA